MTSIKYKIPDKKPWFSKWTNWVFNFFGYNEKCGVTYPDNIFIFCDKHNRHLGKHCSRGGVNWK